MVFHSLPHELCPCAADEKSWRFSAVDVKLIPGSVFDHMISDLMLLLWAFLLFFMMLWHVWSKNQTHHHAHTLPHDSRQPEQ